MPNATWNGWSLQTGNTAGSLSNGILTLTTTATGQGSAYEYPIVASAGDEIELEVSAKLLSGTVYAYIDWVNQGDNTKQGSHLIRTLISDSSGYRPYRLKIKVPQQNENPTVWLGVGVLYSDIGSAAFMNPVVRVNGRATALPGVAYNGWRMSGFNGNAMALAQQGSDMLSFASKAMIYGYGNPITVNDDSTTRALQVHGTSANPSGGFFGTFRNDNGGGNLSLGKSRGVNIGQFGTVLTGDNLWSIRFVGTDGTQFRRGATINAFCEATPANTFLPTYVTINTSSATASDLERMRIDSKGNVSVGTAALATGATDGFLYIPQVSGTPTGAPTSKTGASPIAFDPTAGKLWIYTGSAWKSATLA